MAKSRIETARLLAESHFRVEPDLKHIFLLTSDREDDPKEPIKLLEIVDFTLADEIMPVSFAPDPARGVNYPSSIVEMSTKQYEGLQGRTIWFRGSKWKIGEELLPVAAGR
jgi:hypothetical protein